MIRSPTTRPSESAVPRWMQRSRSTCGSPVESRQSTRFSPSNRTLNGVSPSASAYATGCQQLRSAAKSGTDAGGCSITDTAPQLMRPARQLSCNADTVTSLDANARRNAAGGLRRWWRWRGTRAAAWALLERHVAPGATVAVIGAGNGHDLPLRRLGRRAGRLDLIDLDARALARTRRRLLLSGVRAEAIAQDVTHGRADTILQHVLARRPLRPAPVAPSRSGGRPYDVVIADQFLSQLLYPALSDSHLSRGAIDAALRTHGQSLTNAVVAGLVAAAPGGRVICVEDVLGGGPAASSRSRSTRCWTRRIPSVRSGWSSAASRRADATGAQPSRWRARR